MTRVLSFRNRQRTRALNLPLLRRITRHLLEKELGVTDYELGFHFVDAPKMARLNQQFLGHEGSTDVITFNHAEEHPSPHRMHGEVFISVPDALKQAGMFQTTWPSEIVRYIIHGLLHLSGYDDLKAAARRVMKHEERRLLRHVAKSFRLADIARRSSQLPTLNSQPA